MVEMKVIARVRSDFPSKFGIPRQSGLVPELAARIVMEPEYRVAEAFRGLEEYSHIWLVWEFSAAPREDWSPTVRPPRLGGNTRVGVFASRSPFRPNPIGLSCVALDRIEMHPQEGPVLYIKGADLLDGTPIYDIKPYLAYTDSRPTASGSFAERHLMDRLQVVCPREWQQAIPEERWKELTGLLSQDPRPAYQKDPDRIYGMAYAQWDIRFRVEGDTLTICQVVPRTTNKGVTE